MVFVFKYPGIFQPILGNEPHLFPRFSELYCESFTYAMDISIDLNCIYFTNACFDLLGC